MLRRLTLAAAASLIALPALATAALAEPVTPAPVVAAERAFAADAPGMGITGSFTKWSVDDAVVIDGGEARTVREVYPPSAPKADDEPLLEWWPNWAGIARSGDLGFTTGGVAVNHARAGHYFTIWKKQPDGTWKWVYDGGVGVPARDVPGPGTEPAILPVSTVRGLYPESAMAGVQAAEAALARAAAADQAAAHLAAFAPDGRLYVAPLPPATTPEAVKAALASWPRTFIFEPATGGGAASAGDLVWTYGRASWVKDGADRKGWYVRLWQRRPGDGGRPDVWKLVFAQLIPTRPPAPPPAAG